MTKSRTTYSEVCPFFFLSPQKTSKEDMPGTSLQPTSNNLLTNNNRPNELLLDKPSEDLNTSPVGPQVDIGVPPQQKVCHQKKDTVPVQPVKMKDGTASAPDCIQKSDNFAKANDLTPFYGINKGESSIVQDTTEYAGDHKQKCETGPVHISLDVVPPPHVKRRDDSLPTETLKTALFKPLRRKDKKMHADSAYQQTDTESVCLMDTKKPSSTEEWFKKHNASVQASSHVILPLKPTKGTMIIKLKPEPEVANVKQTASFSLIKKIHLPQRGKTLSLSKSGKVDKGIIAQNLETDRESVEPVQTENTTTGDMEKIKHSSVASDTYVQMINISSDQKSDEASEIAERDKQPTHLLPRPRVRKRFLPDEFMATDSTSEAFRREEAQAAKKDNQSSIPSTTTELSVAQECKDFPQPFLHDQPFTATEKMISVPLMTTRLTTDSSVQPEDAVTSEKTPRSSNLPVPKPRVKKCLSDSFPYVVTVSGLSPPTVADNLYPVALPRAKKRLSATYLDSTTDSVCHLEMELSHSNPEDSTVTSKETKKEPTSLDLSVISEGGFVTVQDEDEVLSKLEKEVLAAMQEEGPQPDSIESTEKALDENIEDWTFTDKPVKDEPEKTVEQVNREKVLEAEVDRSLTSTVASKDDWLHVEANKDSEEMEMNLRNELRDEDVEFGFVSVDVTSGCLEDQR